MSVSKIFITLAAPALLTLSACGTPGFKANVARFQAMPAPQGQSFVIQAADPMNRGGLEFSQYSQRVRQHLLAQGYTEAPSAQAASLLVMLDYGVDNGQTEVRSYPSFGGFGYGGYGGYGGFGYGRPYYSRFGYYGARSPFYYGWNDPFWGGGYGYNDIDTYTVFTSYLDMDIKRAADGQSVFEGTAKARSRTDNLQVLVPNLVEAMFQGFPGRSGETVKITVPAPARSR